MAGVLGSAIVSVWELYGFLSNRVFLYIKMQNAKHQLASQVRETNGLIIQNPARFKATR